MSKIGLITYHDTYNYGAALQAYATEQYLKSHSFDVETINYFPKNLQGYGTFSKTFEETYYKSHNIVKRILLTIIRVPSYKKLRKVFDKFAAENLNLTKTYLSLDELTADVPNDDFFCTGSDQVWNNYYTHSFDAAFFLDFVPSEKRCFSLSSSFGKADFSPEELEYIKEHVKKYDYISVREKSAKKLLNDLGYEKVSVMLDPTLLADPDIWNRFAGNTGFTYPYILVYQLHSDGRSYKNAVEFAKKSGLKVVRINVFYHQLRPGCKNVAMPDLHRFVGLFKNAEYVFTDSFHGTVFSILFSRKLAVDMPQKFSDRLSTLLELVGATDFLFEDVASWNDRVENFDFGVMLKKLNTLRLEKTLELQSYLDTLRNRERE